MIKNFVKTFFKSEIAIGITLMIATIAALLISNSESFKIYENFFLIDAPLSLESIGLYKNLTIRGWINDALMAVFFLLVGSELKREILIGELSSRKKFLLPAIAAIGGIILPLLIFTFFNYDNAENMRGFAIPAATDIAFAYGMISLFGKKISNSLKVFLVALAVLDDLVAILIIAFFYSQNLDLNYLALAALAISLLAFLNYKNCAKISFYLIAGIFLWLFILKSGIHATLAGVALAMFIPLRVKNNSLLEKLAHKISPSVNFLILPLFAFANAGVRIENFSPQNFATPIVLGISLGLFFGKQIGVMLFSFIAVKSKFCNLPRGANWREFYGAAIFTGIGFTMSLFIAGLSYAQNQSMLDQAKIGILIGSLLSMIAGILMIFVSLKIKNK